MSEKLDEALKSEQKDPLTGFFMRDSLSLFMQRLISEFRSGEGKHFSIVLMDIDRFKMVNDKFGHPAGDNVLRHAASVIRSSFSSAESYMFRYGGDEFISVFPGKEPKEILQLVKQCVRSFSQVPFSLDDKPYKITVSCGISGFPSEGDNMEKLIDEADNAMYFSKRHGRNRVTMADSVKYLNMRKFILSATNVIIVLCSLFIIYKYWFGNIIKPVIGYMHGVKLVTNENKPDKIILKNGDSFEGKIVYEDGDKIIFELSLSEGKGTSTFLKSEISEIKYGTKARK